MAVQIKSMHIVAIAVVIVSGIAFVARDYIRPSAPSSPSAAPAAAVAPEIFVPTGLGERVLPSQPLASSGTPVTIAKLMDGDPQTWWSSSEKGNGVKDHAWIGARFASPTAITNIVLRQTWNKPFRQDQIRVQVSEDGVSWRDALPAPFPTIKDETTISVANAPAAAWWRLVAAADNAAARPDANWTPLDVFFFAAPVAKH